MMPVPTYTRLAQDDLNDLFDFIAADNPSRARSYIAEIQQACRALCETPALGIARPDIRQDLRIFTLRRRVIVAYRILPNEIEILRVFSAGRDYAAIMGGD